MWFDNVAVRRSCTVPSITYQVGKSKMAALAVLFAMNPRVYLLDEPFASIDRKSRIEMLEILKELPSNGKTVYFVRP